MALPDDDEELRAKGREGRRNVTQSDRDSEARRGCPRGHDPDRGAPVREDMAGPGNPALLEGKADEQTRVALRLALGDGLGPDKAALRELYEAVQAGLERRSRVVELVAVERECSLKPQGIARPEAAGLKTEGLARLEGATPRVRPCASDSR